MQDDELIYLGATILLAGIQGQDKLDGAIAQAIPMAVANAHSLHEEVKKLREKLRANQPLGLFEAQERMAKAT